MLNPGTISEMYRGVVVVTTTSGASRRPYPTRSVYPAVVVSSGGHMFAIADFATAEEEPRDAAGFPVFLARLDGRSVALERRIATDFGMASFIPSRIEVFPGFPSHRTRPHSLLERTPSVLGLAPDPVGESTPRQLDLVIPVGDRSRRATEYILVAGTARFYKAAEPMGAHCEFHHWKNARAFHAAAPAPHVGYGVVSFTEDGQSLHCSHADLHSMRQSRCHVAVIEAHLCCRACVYEAVCWAQETREIPCPPNRQTG